LLAFAALGLYPISQLFDDGASVPVWFVTTDLMILGAIAWRIARMRVEAVGTNELLVANFVSSHRVSVDRIKRLGPDPDEYGALYLVLHDRPGVVRIGVSPRRGEYRERMREALGRFLQEAEGV
jgi:hypothetical protein